MSGMANNRPILSICIPTFNGGDKLKICLDNLVESLSNRNDVQVVVSDNCSTDNTSLILSEYKKIPGILLSRNDVNLGFNGNFNLIIDRLAIGEYCWIIGDDDFLDQDAISKIIAIINKERPSYITVKHRVSVIEDYLKLQIDPSRDFDYFKDTFFRCIDYNSSDSNVLGTFMSSQIFLLDKLKAVDRSKLGVNTWSDFRTTFPNSYMMTKLFFNDKNCICVKTPVITALSHQKSWDDKMYYIRTRILPDYYNYCLTLTVDKKELSKTKTVIQEGIFLQTILDIKYHKLSRIKWRTLFSLPFIKYALKHL